MSVYAVADLHSQYKIWTQIKEYLKPEDTLYVLGDCVDRGKKGFDILKEVYEHPQTILLMGNHEDMLMHALKKPSDRALHKLNGGAQTYNRWKYKYGGDLSWIDKINQLPMVEEYTNKDGENIILCHAGYTPHRYEMPLKDDYIWNRYHFNQQWDMDYENTYIIHGHTPILCMEEYLYPYKKTEDLYKPFWYSEDGNGIKHKCNIDCGAFLTKKSILLDLDTFDYVIFSEE